MHFDVGCPEGHVGSMYVSLCFMHFFHVEQPGSAAAREHI